MLKELRGIFFREIAVTIKSPRMFFQAFLEPLMYFLLFVPVMSKAVGEVTIDGQAIPFAAFVLPGIIIFNSFTGGQYSGISFYIDKLSGELEVLFGLPLRRYTLLIGKAMSAIIKAIIQSVILIVCAYLLGYLDVFVSFQNLLSIILIASSFSVFSVLFFSGLSSLIKTQDTFNIVINMISMPLLFTSTAFYTNDGFPGVLRYVSMVNPMSYVINLMRQVMFGLPMYGVSVIAVMVGILILTFFIATQCVNRSM